MTIFGIIWIIICFIAFIIKDVKYMIFLTMIAMVLQSNNVIDTPLLSCGPQIITSLLFIIKSYLYKFPKPQNNSLKNSILNIWIIFGIYIIFNYLFINSNKNINNFLEMIMLISYIYTCYRISKISKYLDNGILYNFIKKITVFLLIIGYLNILISIINLPILKNLLKTLLFNDITTNSYFYKSSTRFFSTLMEPSYLAGLLSGLIIYFFVQFNKFSSEKNFSERNKTFLILIFSCLGIILTRSSTGYDSLAIILFLYFIQNLKKRRTFIYIIITFCLVLFIGMSTNLLNEVIFNKMDTASSRVRTQLNESALEAFKQKPLLGNGYKFTRASSIIYDIASNLGIVGIVLYGIFILILLKRIISKKYTPESKKICYILLGVVVSQLIACPDIDFSPFWLGMYIICFYDGKNKIKESNV